MAEEVRRFADNDRCLECATVPVGSNPDCENCRRVMPIKPHMTYDEGKAAMKKAARDRFVPIDDGGPAETCARCRKPAHIKQGRQWLCAEHYRFGQMRATAKRHGKDVPSHRQLNEMLGATNGMRCIGCDRLMNWLSTTDQSSVISLQHDRGGTMRFLCRACNTRHAAHPGDTYYTVPKDGKWCPDCDLVLHRLRFSRDRSRPLGRKTYCKDCSSKRQRKWVNENREHYNAYQRKQRAARKVAG